MLAGVVTRAGSLPLLVKLAPLTTEDLAVVYLPLLPVGLWELLGELGIRLIEVPEEEFASLGCNVLAVRPGVVVMAVDRRAELRPIRQGRCRSALPWSMDLTGVERLLELDAFFGEVLDRARMERNR